MGKRIFIAMVMAGLAFAGPAFAHPFGTGSSTIVGDVQTTDPAASSDDPANATRLEAEALALTAQGDFAGADARILLLMDVERRLYGEASAFFANSIRFRAHLALSRDDRAAADARYREELGIRRVLGDATMTRNTELSLALNLIGQSRMDEAVVLLAGLTADPAIDRRDPDLGRVALDLANALLVTGRNPEAEALLTPFDTALADAEGTVVVVGVAQALAVALHNQSRLAEAEAVGRRACALATGPGAADPRQAASPCYTWSVTLTALGRQSEAEAPLVQALAAAATPGPTWLSPLQRAEAMLSLIGRREASGRSIENEADLRTVVNLRTETYGADSPLTALALNELGRWLVRHDRSDEGIGVLHQARTLYRDAEGASAPSVSSVSLNLAGALAAVGRQDEAITLLRDTLEAPDLAPLDREQLQLRVANTIAFDDLDASLPLMEAVLASREARGADATLIADAAGAVSNMRAHGRDILGAFEARRRAIAARDRTDDLRGQAMERIRLANLLNNNRDELAARELLDQIWPRRDIVGLTQDERLYALYELTRAYLATGRLAEADAYSLDLLSARRIDGDPEGLQLALRNRAFVLSDLNDFNQAETLLREALALAQIHDPTGEDAGMIDEQLSNLLTEQGATGQSSEAMLARIDDVTARYGPDSHNLVVALSNLAQALRMEGHPDRAIPILERAIAIERTLINRAPADLLAVEQILGRTYAEAGMTEKAGDTLGAALIRARREIGRRNPVTLELAAQAGFLLAENGQAAAASILLRKTSMLTEQIYGPDAYQLTNPLQLWAFSLHREGDRVRTIKVMRRVERLVDASGGRWPSTRLDVKGNLGRILLDAGRLPEALRVLREAQHLSLTAARGTVRTSADQRREIRYPSHVLVEAAWQAAQPK